MIDNAKIVDMVQHSFGALWKHKVRGEALEIISAFTTTGRKFISVFISRQGPEFVVSDGGWMWDGVYDTSVDSAHSCFVKLLEHYTESFDISSTKSKTGATFYYKKTADLIHIPSLILDLASFMTGVLGAADVEFMKRKDRSLMTFSREADEYLTSINHKGELVFDYAIPGTAAVKVDAKIERPHRGLVLVNYVNGSTTADFVASVNNANVVFRTAKRMLGDKINLDEIAIVDDTAPGSRAGRALDFFYALKEDTDCTIINWSNRQNLVQLIDSAPGII